MTCLPSLLSLITPIIHSSPSSVFVTSSQICCSNTNAWVNWFRPQQLLNFVRSLTCRFCLKFLKNQWHLRFILIYEHFQSQHRDGHIKTNDILIAVDSGLLTILILLNPQCSFHHHIPHHPLWQTSIDSYIRHTPALVHILSQWPDSVN